MLTDHKGRQKYTPTESSNKTASETMTLVTIMKVILRYQFQTNSASENCSNEIDFKIAYQTEC